MQRSDMAVSVARQHAASKIDKTYGAGHGFGLKYVTHVPRVIVEADGARRPVPQDNAAVVAARDQQVARLVEVDGVNAAAVGLQPSMRAEDRLKQPPEVNDKRDGQAHAGGYARGAYVAVFLSLLNSVGAAVTECRKRSGDAARPLSRARSDGKSGSSSTRWAAPAAPACQTSTTIVGGGGQ